MHQGKRGDDVDADNVSNRVQVDVPLVATILRVKITDAMLGLMLPSGRKTPPPPVKLSYAEDAAETAETVDWSNVDFSDDDSVRSNATCSALIAR